ncbi:MAG: hypothetical protein AAF085_14200 [Planctomycetota bacterium]
MSENEPQSDSTSEAEVQTPPSPAQIKAMLEDLPEVKTPHDAAECVKRAKRLSTRGKLPGFVDTSKDGPGLFTCAAFDYRLVIDHWNIGAFNAITFRAERLKKLPIIYAVVLAITVWPGVVFTDSLLNTWFGWYPNPWWFTWAWYIPMTAFPIPWIWRSVANKSRASALLHGHEQIDKIIAALDGAIMDKETDVEDGEQPENESGLAHSDEPA